MSTTPGQAWASHCAAVHCSWPKRQTVSPSCQHLPQRPYHLPKARGGIISPVSDQLQSPRRGLEQSGRGREHGQDSDRAAERRDIHLTHTCFICRVWSQWALNKQTSCFYWLIFYCCSGGWRCILQMLPIIRHINHTSTWHQGFSFTHVIKLNKPRVTTMDVCMWTMGKSRHYFTLWNIVILSLIISWLLASCVHLFKDRALKFHNKSQHSSLLRPFILSIRKKQVKTVYKVYIICLLKLVSSVSGIWEGRYKKSWNKNKKYKMNFPIFRRWQQRVSVHRKNVTIGFKNGTDVCKRLKWKEYHRKPITFNNVGCTFEEWLSVIWKIRRHVSETWEYTLKTSVLVPKSLSLASAVCKRREIIQTSILVLFVSTTFESTL